MDLLRVLLKLPQLATIFSTIQNDVRAGAIRVEISDRERWSPGDVAILQNQETKRDREIGSLIFHDYEASVEVRSLLSTEVMEEIDGRLAVTDVDYNGQRYVKFWIDDLPSSPTEEQATNHIAEERAAARKQFPMPIPAFPVLGERTAEPRAPHTHLKGERGLPLIHHWIYWCSSG